jgi:hypothetical protein
MTLSGYAERKVEPLNARMRYWDYEVQGRSWFHSYLRFHYSWAEHTDGECSLYGKLFTIICGYHKYLRKNDIAVFDSSKKSALSCSSTF